MKKAQITIFIVISILIVASILLLFALRSRLFPSAGQVEEKLRPFTESYSLCVKQLGEEAVQNLGQKAGYIYLPDKEQGSDFMPFSNSLDFLGDEIPYWLYISANGIEKQQIPSLTDMKAQIEKYVEQNVERCDAVITEFSLQGFKIEKKGKADARATIKPEEVALTIIAPLSVQLQETRARVDVYNIKIDKPVGRSYEAAKKIMQAENEQLFLEERTIDAIFLYEELPSTQTTLECYPKNWQLEQVKADLQRILANNIPFTKIKNTNYAKANSYYEIDAGLPGLTGSADKLTINFIFIEQPLKLEINGKQQGTVKGESISQLEAAYLRNFLCLTSYDFVYTIAYPVLVNVYDSKSGYAFQFPFVVYVNKNSPRKAVETDFELEEVESQVCKNKIAEETVLTFDSSAKPLADVLISYKCINTVCDIGTTQGQEQGQEQGQGQTNKTTNEAILKANFPQCVNGFVIAEKPGYARAKQQISTNIDKQTINLMLEPLTNLNVELKLINSLGAERSLQADETAIITLLNEERELAETLLYPEDRNVELVDGNYNVRIQVFKTKPITLEQQQVERCFKVPSGILGIFGIKDEKCETIEIPETKLEQIIFGGTQFNAQLEVQGKKSLIIFALENPVPQSVDEMNAILADISLNKDSPLFKQPELS